LRPSKLSERLGKRLEVAGVVARGEGRLRAIVYLITSIFEPLVAPFHDLQWMLRSRLAKGSVVHVIGDSHSKTFRGHRGFIVHHIGAATAHNLKKRGSATGSNERLFHIIDRLPKAANVLLVFGEIDCRIHAYYQFRKSDEQRTLEEIIDLTLRNYGEVIDQIRDRGIDPCILSVAPATTVGNEYNFPYYATPELRGEITGAFNDGLEALCERNGWTYINLYPLVSDGRGMRREEYAADQIHLNGRVVEIVRTQLREKRGLSV
jgi:lysophospholipase L1-like esterase